MLKHPGLTVSIALLGLALLLPVSIRAGEDAVPESARQVLAKAFHHRYDCDSRQVLTLILRSNGREFQRQRIGVATKFVNGRMRAVGRFTNPSELRDTAVLLLEEEEEGTGDQLFVFLPMLGRVRRVSGAQRGDSFMGTDLTYEDLQRPRVEDYSGFALRSDEVDDEPVLVVTATPRRGTYYEWIEVSVARRDSAILRVRFFQRDAPEPFKIIETPRSALVREGDALVPRRLTVLNRSRRTETEVFVDELELHAQTDDQAFTTSALVTERAIPKPSPATDHLQ